MLLSHFPCARSLNLKGNVILTFGRGVNMKTWDGEPPLCSAHKPNVISEAGAQIDNNPPFFPWFASFFNPLKPTAAPPRQRLTKTPHHDNRCRTHNVPRELTPKRRAQSLFIHEGKLSTAEGWSRAPRSDLKKREENDGSLQQVEALEHPSRRGGQFVCSTAYVRQTLARPLCAATRCNGST